MRGNLKGIVSPTNKKYTAQLVERSLFKFLNRLKRESEIELVSVNSEVIGLKKKCKYNDLICYSKTIPLQWNNLLQ